LICSSCDSGNIAFSVGEIWLFDVSLILLFVQYSAQMTSAFSRHDWLNYAGDADELGDCEFEALGELSACLLDACGFAKNILDFSLD
jgi:hypothetical protein